MLAPLEMMNVDAIRCNACGATHQFRISVSGDVAVADGAMHGFFGRCPVTARRTWFVIPVPIGAEGEVRLVEVGPVDDTAWEPTVEEEGVWALVPPVVLPAADSAARVAGPSRGMLVGGFRVQGRAPEVLRRALGCPHSR
ncbi:MAG: hypothetical protein KF785_11235 [Gemmatimonadales bacterium]|nr:hypothetical protein [Gemmatimonadales bacterium]